MDALIDSLPGYRRRFVITPAPGVVRSELEDDFHCMGVELRHDNGVVTAVRPLMARAPWTTCPGAVAALERTFTGHALSAFATRGDKPLNCTHLYDLAQLAAAHALDDRPLTYDMLVSDPIDGRIVAELRRDGETTMRWELEGMTLRAPAELADLSLLELGPWIASLDASTQEAARLLRWASMVAHGRTIPLADQSDARKLARGSCYTFQPETAARAERVGEIRDFSQSGAAPLDRPPFG